MIVRELIEALSKFNEEALVVISGYEGGVTENLSPEEIEIALNVNTEWWYGEHERVQEWAEYPEHDHVKAVII